MPARRLFPNELEIMPTNVGPTEQPISPASASIANKAVPPPFMADEALLKVPGHRIPTEKPHTAHPIRFMAGIGTNARQR